MAGLSVSRKISKSFNANWRLVLFPAVREAEEETIIVASGTSCRHQIADGTGKKALHPVEVLFSAMR